MPHLNCSVCQPPATSFSAHPIGTLAALAGILRLTTSELATITENANHLYRVGKRERKSDGTTRVCFDALRPLKSVQARIQCLILNKVDYPPYLQGGIKDRRSPRGQAANARLHVNKETLITEDIRQFFPSIRRHVVFDIWHRFFHFPPVVAECLTKLATKEGALPQGAKTSALLANLVFWQNEWRVAACLHARGITYSRLVDDITCSSNTRLEGVQLTRCIALIRAMCQQKGLQLNRRKQTIVHSGARMVATKLVVNDKTSLPAERRSAIRAAVAAIIATPLTQRGIEPFEKRYRSVAGKLSYLKQHHAGEAARLGAQLQNARPSNNGS